MKRGNTIATDILHSYARAEFFTSLPDVDEKIDVVTYVAAEGDISTDLLSPGNQAHSRSDRELHGKCMISERAQAEIQALKLQHPENRSCWWLKKALWVSARPVCQGSIMWPCGQDGKPALCAVCEYRADCGGHQWHLTYFSDHCRGHRRDWCGFEKLGEKLDDAGNPIPNNDGNPVLEQNILWKRHNPDD